MATEDFTTYDEVDPNSRITVTASKLDINALYRNEDAYISDDKGAGHFATTFDHDVKVTQREAQFGALGVFWAVSNSVDDLNALITGNLESIVVYFYAGSPPTITLRETEASVFDTYTYTNETAYYCSAERTGDTTMVLRIYSDAAHTSLLDTLAVAVPAGDSYRYVFAAMSYNTGTNLYLYYDVENLDLNEGAPTFVPYPFSRGLRGGLHALTGGLA